MSDLEGELYAVREDLQRAADAIDGWDGPRDRLGLIPIDGRPWVYLIRAVGTPYVKIGITTSNEPDGRVGALQTGCPHELRLEQAFAAMDASWEGLLHKVLERFRVRGEWFELDVSETHAVASCGWRGYIPFVCPQCAIVYGSKPGDVCTMCAEMIRKEKARDEAEQLAANLRAGLTRDN